MAVPEDHFTSTVDGAAAYERMRAEADDPPPDRPDPSEYMDDEEWEEDE